MLVIVHWMVNANSRSHPDIFTSRPVVHYTKYIFYYLFHVLLLCFLASGQVWLFLYGILYLQYPGIGKIGIEHANKILPFTVLKSYPAQVFIYFLFFCGMPKVCICSLYSPYIERETKRLNVFKL